MPKSPSGAKRPFSNMREHLTERGEKLTPLQLNSILK